MLWLRDHDRYETLAALDEHDGAFALHPGAGETRGPASTDGFFVLAGGNLLALYKSAGRLFVRCGAQSVPLSPEVSVVVSGVGERRIVRVLKDSTELMRMNYRTGSKIPGDPTPFIDEEDFDFGLFVSRIAASPERQSVLLETLGGTTTESDGPGRENWKDPDRE